jgi:hypothetical protein
MREDMFVEQTINPLGDDDKNKSKIEILKSCLCRHLQNHIP